MPLLSVLRGDPRARHPVAGIAAASFALAGITASLAPFLGEREIVLVAMLFMLVVLLAAAIWGYAAGLFGAVLANVLLNVFFISPLHTVAVAEPRNVAALAAFLAVAAIGGALLGLLRKQLAAAEARRIELTMMLGLSRELAVARSPERALDALAAWVRKALGAKRCEILVHSGNSWRSLAATGPATALTRDEGALAAAAIESAAIRRSSAGESHARRLLPRAERHAAHTFVPFRPPDGEPGVIHVWGPMTAREDASLDALLRGFADEAAVAVQRALLAHQARAAQVSQRSDEFKSVLLSSVSHDLRSPLTAIKAAVGSLRTPNLQWPEEDRQELLGAIESQTDRLTGTVTDLLEMSRLEGGAVQPSFEPVNVQAALDEAVRASTAAAGRTIRIDAPPDLWVRADYGLLLHALTNLVENAARYSTPGGPITLRGESSGGRALLEVSDEGPGISTADLPHVFEKFYRGAAGKTAPGSGMGLAIVRAMIELCGGRVTVESTAAGTTFRVSLQPTAAPK